MGCRVVIQIHNVVGHDTSHVSATSEPGQSGHAIRLSSSSKMPLDKLLFLLLLTLSSSLAFLDDVGGAFRHAGAYAKEALSYAKDLMDTAERVYEAYESVIDEECAFDLCDHDRTGLRAAPDPRHVPRANGCGTVNYLFDHTDESPVRLDPSFTECCDQHDFCYDRCGADRDLVRQSIKHFNIV